MLAAESTLTIDVPCAGCRYDLRGLSAQGRCPECGGSIADSLAAAVAERTGAAGRTAAPLNPWWRREIKLAVVAALVAPVLSMGPLIASGGELRLDRVARGWVLGFAAAGWVLQWYAALKLTTAEPSMLRSRWQTVNARVLRSSATLYLLVPFIWGLFLPRFDPHPLAVAAATVARWCVLPASVAFLLQVRFLFRRLAVPAAAAQAGLLAFLLPASVHSYILFGYSGGPSSLELILALPNSQVGPPVYLAYAVVALWELDGWIHTYTAHALLVLASLYLLTRLLVRLLRPPTEMLATDGPLVPLQRGPDGPATAEGSGRSSAASSPP